MLQHQNSFVLSFSALFLAIFFCHCSATQFIVGDSSGWTIPPYPTYYSNWSHSQFMRAGDFLVVMSFEMFNKTEFDFDPKFYNLVQVTESEYDHCTSLEPLMIFNSSPAIIPLRERGALFFTCSISNYCCLGQKIAITVHENITLSPSPSPSPSQVPLSPNGSAPQPISPASTISPMPSTTPGGNNGEHSPVPSSNNQGEKSNAVALVCGTTFSVSLGRLLSMFGSFLGFWVM